MSVDTKLILCVEDSELATVGKLVMEATHGYVKDMIKKEPEEPLGLPKGCSFPQMHSRNFENFNITFSTALDGNRMLFMNLGCSEDEEELTGGKNYIIFSLGAWGDCVNIMQALKTALTPLGSVYYLENDFDGEWEEV